MMMVVDSFIKKSSFICYNRPALIGGKLRALELLYKYLGLGDRGNGVDKVVIVDDV